MQPQLGRCFCAAPSAAPQPPLTTQVLLGNQELTAFLDSGSAVSMVRSHLLPAGLLVLGWARISCLHRHTQRLPLVRATLHYLGQPHDLNLVRTDDLP